MLRKPLLAARFSLDRLPRRRRRFRRRRCVSGLPRTPMCWIRRWRAHFVGRIVFAAMCDKLVDISPELDIVPQLATEWQWTEANRALVMKLRPGVKFHDGEAFDAAAVRVNIERHLTLPGSPEKPRSARSTMVVVVDDHTVKFVLSAPFAPLLSQLSDRAGMNGVRRRRPSRAASSATGRFAPDRTNSSSGWRRTASSSNASPITGTRTRCISTGSPFCRSPIRRCGWPICNRAGSDLIERVAATDLDQARQDPRIKTADITGLGYTGLTINLNNGVRAKTRSARMPGWRRGIELAIDTHQVLPSVFNGPSFSRATSGSGAGHPIMSGNARPGRPAARCHGESAARRRRARQTRR